MRRKGFLDLEWATILCFIIIIAGTLFSVYRLWNADGAPVNTSNHWLQSCQGCLEKMNRDIKFAATTDVASDSLKISRSDGKVIVYRVNNETLTRQEDQGQNDVLLNHLQSGIFSISPKLPDLISVMFLPQDRMAFPFFTSFATRREKP